MDYTEIIYEKLERIATITLNRPEKLNAWTPTMGVETRNAMMRAEHDEGVNAIIITGAGRAFCAGADMSSLSQIARGEARASGPMQKEPWLESQRADYRTPYSYLLGMRKPVIAAINGACVGLGFTTALYYDIRIAAEGARLGLIFPQRGLAIEHGSSWMLPRIVGVARAVEMAITGRLVSAQEALAMGLISKVVAPDKLMGATREAAGEIAAKCSPLGVAEAKRLVYKHLFTDLASAIADDDESMTRMTASEDFKEGVKAFVEKRPAQFRGR